MDAFIVGLVLVVITGILVTWVRRAADKPAARCRRAASGVDAVDVDILGRSLQGTLADFAGDDPIDMDFGD